VSTGSLSSQEGELESGSIGLFGAVLFTVCFMAPAMSIFFTTPAIAGMVGTRIPLVYVIAMIGVLCTGSALAVFSRESPSSGSFITYISRAFNGRVGLVAAVVLLVGYVLAASTVIDIFGSLTSNAIVVNFGVSIPWQLLALAGGIVFILIALRGLSLSTKTSAVLFAFEIIILLIIAVVVLIRGGDAGLTAEPFSPAKLSFGALGPAIVLAVYGFIGYEAAVALGEETRHARRNVGLAVLLSTLLLGVLFVLMTYVAIIGFGVHNIGALASSSAAFDTLGHRYLGGGRFLVDIAGITSTSASAIALLNVQTRLLFNIGRAGFGSKLAMVHPRWKSPVAAILLFGGLIVILPVVLGFAGMAPLQIFAVIGTYAGLPIVVIYAAVNVALTVDWVRRGRQGGIFLHVVVPFLGAATWIMTIYYTVKLGQPSPYNWTWLAFVIPLIAGLVLLLVTRGRDHGRLAKVFGGEGGISSTPEPTVDVGS
jgi:amino acid transporter